MNKKLLKRLGLDEGATPEAIEAAVETILDRNDELEAENDALKKAPAAPAETPTAKLEKRISAKIAESGGALNREQAKIAIEHQDIQDAKTKGAKK